MEDGPARNRAAQKIAPNDCRMCMRIPTYVDFGRFERLASTGGYGIYSNES
jgi:hypothetical protein